MTGNKIIQEDLENIINAQIDWQKFNGKTVLISGANGFLPAYMVESLLFLLDKKIITGLKIIALIRNLTKARTRFKYYINRKELQFINQDVCNFFEIPDKIDFIIHAASQASPKYFGTDPVGTLKANTIGTINLLNIARINKIESFLFFSTSEVYGLLGEKFIECHHKIHLSTGERLTQIGDLALVCSNCHRMLHRKRPWLTIYNLKDLLK